MCIRDRRYADHARGNRDLQAELRTIFKTRSSREWIEFSARVNTPIAPVNTPQNIVNDPQFAARFSLLPHETHGADMLSFPVHFIDEQLAAPGRAPTVGEHTDEVLRDVLGCDEARAAAIRESGALGNAAK